LAIADRRAGLAAPVIDALRDRTPAGDPRLKAIARSTEAVARYGAIWPNITIAKIHQLTRPHSTICRTSCATISQKNA
jgi:hypothetical protein